MNTLDSLRQEIDLLDGQIMELFARRMEVAARMARTKRQQHLPILDRNREEAVLRSRCAVLDPALRPHGAKLMRTLIDCSKAWQLVQFQNDPATDLPTGMRDLQA